MSQTTIKSAPVDLALPPTQYDLPCDDDIPMETQRHFLQMQMLRDTLVAWLAQREDGYVGGNMFLYFSAAQIKNQDFRGPDVFVVLGVPKGERLSWVVWDEGKAPDVVIELISNSTATKDKTEKKQIYQDKVRVPEYFWYNPFDAEDWAGFSLQGGVYQPMNLDEQGRFVSQVLGLALVRWQGSYKDIQTTWLRWATLAGELLLTPEEEAAQAQQQAEQAQQQAEQAQQQAEQAQQRAEQLAERLREMGIEPDEV